MSSASPAIKLVGKHGIPEHLLTAMVKHGIDPRASYVEAADGWRYGDPRTDLSSPEEIAETLELTRAAVAWVEDLYASGPSDEAGLYLLSLADDRD